MGYLAHIQIKAMNKDESINSIAIPQALIPGKITS